jgi:hypothetical protein
MKLLKTGLHTLDNYYFAFGNTELSNKMVPYMTDQEVSVIQTFLSSGDYCVAVGTQHRVAPFRDPVYWIVKQSEETEVCVRKTREGMYTVLFFVCTKFVIFEDITWKMF